MRSSGKVSTSPAGTGRAALQQCLLGRALRRALVDAGAVAVGRGVTTCLGPRINYQDLRRFDGDFMGFIGDFVGSNCDFMGFNDGLLLILVVV